MIYAVQCLIIQGDDGCLGLCVTAWQRHHVFAGMAPGMLYTDVLSTLGKGYYREYLLFIVPLGLGVLTLGTAHSCCASRV